MYTKRGLTILKNKIKKTWKECGSVLASSIEELAFIYNEKDFSTFLMYLNRLEQVDKCISLIQRKEDGLYCLDYLKWNDNKPVKAKSGAKQSDG